MAEVNDINERVLNGLLGRALTGWQVCDDGMHFDLDDGKVLIFAGRFSIAVLIPRQGVTH